MLREAQAENLYIITGYTDMRKGANGLLQIIQGQYSLDPYTDSLFLFCGRNARKIKAVLSLIICHDGVVYGIYEGSKI